MNDLSPLEINVESLKFWLALHRAPLIGSMRFRRLLERFGSPSAVFAAGRADWTALGLSARTMDYLSAPDWGAVESDLAWVMNHGPHNHCLTLQDPAYPELLREIADPPAVLFVRGNLSALNRPMIAIVGSRSPTPAGQRTAREFSRQLAAAGSAIVSGLAMGIDAAGHEGALECPGGVTVAVAGTGPDRIYPRQHERLADEILGQGGAIISEYPPGTGPLAGNFPRRNRIISGLALGTLIVEAAPKSGSLITARLALEQNRDVFAIPGSIYSALSRGCNQLIQQGAKLVQEPADILEEYQGVFMQSHAENVPENTLETESDASGLLKYIAYEPTTVDTLAANTGMPAQFIAAALVALELEGLVASMPGGAYMRAK